MMKSCATLRCLFLHFWTKQILNLLFAFYNKASKGECNLNISQKDTPGEEELYEDPVSLSFHASQLLFVIIILTIFAVVIIAVKKKSKINMIKLRSETCSALIKLGSVKKKLTKTKESHCGMETIRGTIVSRLSTNMKIDLDSVTHF